MTHNNDPFGADPFSKNDPFSSTQNNHHHQKTHNNYNRNLFGNNDSSNSCQQSQSQQIGQINQQQNPQQNSDWNSLFNTNQPQKSQQHTQQNNNILALLSKQFAVNCVCGLQMELKQPSKQCTTWCDGDGCNETNPSFTYHCPQQTNSFHSSGYDFCIKCAAKQFKLQCINNDKIKTFSDRMKLIDFTKLKNRFERHSLGLAGCPVHVLEEYKKFLIIKCVGDDFNAKIYSPSPTIDSIWHLHVLDTMQYKNDMNILFNTNNTNNNECFINHNIDGALDVDNKRIRYKNTINQYKKLFNKIPNQQYWEPIHCGAVTTTNNTNNAATFSWC